jgi:hypothetical protein
MALYSTFVKRVLPCVNGSTWLLVNYTAIISIALLVPLVVASVRLGCRV